MRIAYCRILVTWKIWFVLLLGAAACLPAACIAQNARPPMPKFKTVPAPGQDLNTDTLSSKAGKFVLGLPAAKIRGVGVCTIILEFENGMHTASTITTKGKKTSLALLKAMSKQFGLPSKLFDTKDQLRYIWDMKSLFPGDADLVIDKANFNGTAHFKR